MAGIVIILAVLLVVGGFATAMIRAQLVANRNHCQEAWANVGTELQRRHDLIGDLLRTVEAAAGHERRLLAGTAELVALTDGLVSRAGSQPEPSAQDAADEYRLEFDLQGLLGRLEIRPELRADHQFLELQRQLVTTADRIQSVLRYYNANVRAYNNTVQQFPSSIVASLANHRPWAYFRLDDRASGPPVHFDP